MLLRRHPELAVAVAGETSRTTHGSPAAVDSCRYYAGLLVGAMNGAPKEHLLARGGFVPDGLPHDFWSAAADQPLDPDVAKVVLQASHAEKEPPIIRNNGYVVRTLEAALWAFGRSTGFEEGCLLVANLGDDSDTVAAIYGQLAGAFYGMSGIPKNWRDKLALKGLIESMAEELFDMSNRVDPCPTPTPPTAASGSSAASVQPSDGEAPNVRGARLTESPDERVTRFTVKPAAEPREGTKDHEDGAEIDCDMGCGGDYWVGGVGAHYQRLEDEYVKIKAKVNTRSYETLDVFDRDVRGMFLGDPLPVADGKSNDRGEGEGKTPTHGEPNDQSRVPIAEQGAGTATAKRRKGALTAEFVARVEIDRAGVESVVRAWDMGSRLI
eukprot:g14494.t1